jgi:hypothetical protein
MKNIYKLLLCTIILVADMKAKAQINCGYDNISEMNDSATYQNHRNHFIKQIQKFKSKGTFNVLPNPDSIQTLTWSNGCRKVQYLIPVVVHVIYDPSDSLVGMGSNINDVQIQNQIDELNYNLRNQQQALFPAVNTGIQVCLASRLPDGTSFSGITRSSSSLSTHNLTASKDLALKNIIQLPPSQYLNIYVVKTILTATGVDSGVLGYAMGRKAWGSINDGIVMRAFYFGNAQNCSGCNLIPDSRGKSLVHEVGHYLGLLHTFTEACFGGNDSSDCGSKGDLCCDTPPIDGPSASGCSPSSNTCTETPTDKNDQKENFMDYTGEDCFNTFTGDQTLIMQSVLNNERAMLVSATNVNKTQPACCMLNAHFDVEYPTLCKNDSQTFTAVNYRDSTIHYHWNIYRGNTLIYTTNSTSYIYQLKTTDTGLYNVKLVIIGASDSIIEIQNQTFKVINCDSSTASVRGNWYFGYLAGLKFTKSGVVPSLEALKNNTPLNKNTQSIESCISISDSSGNLLFYGGGEEYGQPYHIFNKNYKEMEGSPIYGSGNATQGAISFQHPLHSNQYYLFTTSANIDDNQNGFRYSIIDVNAYDNIWNTYTGAFVKKNTEVVAVLQER